MSHDDASHGPAPLGDVDPEPLHRAVDALAAALHAYVDTAVGVRGEFGAAESDDDPRILALENRVGTLNAGLFDALHDALGIHPDLTTSVWQPDTGHSPPPPAPVDGVIHAEAFYLGFVVAQPPPGAPATMDGVIDLLDEAGEGVATSLTAGGYDVLEWVAARGAAPTFGDDADDIDQEDE